MTENQQQPAQAGSGEPGCYFMGGGWGDRIEWTGRDQFHDMGTRTEFRCHGWKARKPVPGDTLRAEFERSWITFEFIDVTNAAGVHDMFFATVRPINQELKATPQPEGPQ